MARKIDRITGKARMSLKELAMREIPPEKMPEALVPEVVDDEGKKLVTYDANHETGFNLQLEAYAKLSDLEQVEVADVARAIIESDGYLMVAAAKLKVSYSTIHAKINKYPILKQLYEDVCEMMNDLAENVIKRNLRAGNLHAAIYQLRCKGRHRGWVDDPMLLSKAQNQPIIFVYNTPEQKEAVNDSSEKSDERATGKCH